jgi:hypothetical protein
MKSKEIALADRFGWGGLGCGSGTFGSINQSVGESGLIVCVGKIYREIAPSDPRLLILEAVNRGKAVNYPRSHQHAY